MPAGMTRRRHQRSQCSRCVRWRCLHICESAEPDCMRMRPHVVLVSLVLLVSLLAFCSCRGDWGLPFHHRRQPAPSLLLLQPASPPPSRPSPSPPPRTTVAEASELLCRFSFCTARKGATFLLLLVRSWSVSVRVHPPTPAKVAPLLPYRTFLEPRPRLAGDALDA